jgi:dTDP-4-amino-4,6-dideoxygalactose transaminase
MQSSDVKAPSNTTVGILPAVPLLDMQRQHQPLREEIRAAIDRVCDSGRFILGPDCEQLEHSIARYTRTKHAIACASGSDALLLALMALGIGPGDEVILPSYTFFATGSAVWRLGAMPVFVDIDPATYNLYPQATAALITRATKAILPVHLFGQCADMDALGAIARQHGLPIIEDACQSIGAEYHGVPAGAIGDVGCFSFYPTKNLGGFGDGGLLTTNRDDLAARLRLLRAHGMEPRYYHQVVGINSRLDSIQAAVLNVKLPHLDRWAERRQANAALYQRLFAECGLARVLTLPATDMHCTHVWNQYTIRVPDGRRDALRQYLAQMKIGAEIYYPVPLHRQACFRSLAYAEGSLPESERAARETLALPIFPELEPAEIETVVYRIGEFFGIRRPQIDSAVKRPNFLGHPATSPSGLPRVA